MAPTRRQFTQNVTLLGAAPLSERLFAEVRALAPGLVAADGAAKTALQFGAMPDLVVGDFDSLDAATRARIPQDRLLHIAEQDSTDFDKALRSVSAPLVLAVGFTGARLDHELAVYNSLVRRDLPCIVVGEHDLCFHAPRDLRLRLPTGTRLSLFPMAEVSARSEGLRWPVDGLRFAPNGRVGTSNQTVAGEVRLTTAGPGMLAILPRAVLPETVRALGSD